MFRRIPCWEWKKYFHVISLCNKYERVNKIFHTEYKTELLFFHISTSFAMKPEDQRTAEAGRASNYEAEY